MRELMYLLLSIFTMVSLSFVSAEYMIKIDKIQDEEINTTLQNAKWAYYIPQYDFTGKGVITFSSEKDYVRFLIPNNDVLPLLFGNSLFRVSDENTIYTYRITGGSKSFTFKANKDCYVWVYARASGGWNWNTGSLTISKDGIPLSSLTAHWNGAGGNWYFNKVYVSANSTLSISMKVTDSYTSMVFYIVCNKGDLTAEDNPTTIFLQKIPHQLEIYTEPGASIFIDGEQKATTDNGGYIKILVEKGDHELKISKDGFWDYIKIINIQNDTELHISLVPKNSIIGLDYTLTERTYPDSIGTMDIKLTPIVDAYGTTLKLSGADIISVSYNGNSLKEVNDKYILGDLSKGVQTELLIKFKTPSSFGEKSITANIEATDIEGNAYSQTEIIKYNVEELPFLVELPAWKLGDNTVRITDTSGTSYGVSLVLYDKDGNEVWSDSQSMLEYGECDFIISINSPGDYVLEISGAGAKTYKEIHLIVPVSLITKTISAGKGEVATVKFSIINPSNSVKYYYATLDCDLINLSANKTLKQFAVSPNENKTVELSFKVPSDAQYDSYSLNLNVYDNTKELLYSNMIVLDIADSSLMPVGVGGDTLLYLIGAVGLILLLGVGVYFYRVRT
jgi:hypothetical protein